MSGIDLDSESNEGIEDGEAVSCVRELERQGHQVHYCGQHHGHPQQPTTTQQSEEEIEMHTQNRIKDSSVKIQEVEEEETEQQS